MDGVVHGIDNKFYDKINSKISELASHLVNDSLEISKKIFVTFPLKKKKLQIKNQNLSNHLIFIKIPKFYQGCIKLAYRSLYILFS